MNSDLETEKDKLKLQSSGPVYPTSRRFNPIDGEGCNVTKEGKCRSIQIRNVPDLGQVPVGEKLSSNPGCTQSTSNSNYINCPQTDEWKDTGYATASGIFGRCSYGPDERNGSTWAPFDSAPKKNGRMRTCKRLGDDINFNLSSVQNVCSLRKVMFDYNISLNSDEFCSKTPNDKDFQTCESKKNEGFVSTAGKGSTINTDLMGQFQQEFKLPIYEFSEGIDSVIIKQFSNKDIHQYTTCAMEIWNETSNEDKDFRKINIIESAKLVLPPYEDAIEYAKDIKASTKDESIDQIYASTGFWPNSRNKYVGRQNSPKTPSKSYNGLVENGYPGGINFTKNFKRFDKDRQLNFAITFLQNVVDYYLTTPEKIKNSFVNIKSSVRDICTPSDVLSSPDVAKECSVYLKEICKRGEITKDDLIGDSQEKELLRFMCACNMPLSEYTIQGGDDGSSVPQNQQGAVCDPVCLSTTGAFPPLDSEGRQILCTSTTCIISDIDITVIDSNIEGGISVGNLCGDNCNEGGCVCYMNNVSVTIINSSVAGDITIGQECGTCYEVQDSNYLSAKEVDCDTGFSVGTSSANSSFNKTAKWISDNRYWLLPLISSLFALALLAALIVLFIPKKSNSKSNPTKMYDELESEDTYTAEEVEDIIFNVSQANNNIRFEQTVPSISSSLNSLEAQEMAQAPVQSFYQQNLVTPPETLSVGAVPQ